MAKNTWAVIGPLYAHHDQWVTIAAKLVGSTDAEDVVHDAYLRVARAAKTAADGKMMAKTIRNRAIDVLRARREFAVPEQTMTGMLDAVHPITIEGAMFISDFNEALSALSDEQAQAFILIQLRGCTQQEAADVLGITQQSVGARYERARRSLAGALQ